MFEKIKNLSKRMKVISAVAGLIIVVGLGFGIWHFSQAPGTDTQAADSSKQTETKTKEDYLKEYKSIREQQEEAAKKVEGKEVELKNEPAAEPEVPETPKYDSKEAAAQDTPAAPAQATQPQTQPSTVQPTPQPSTSASSGGSSSGSSGSNLVPDSQNPFANPNNAAQNVQVEDGSKYGEWGNGDKF